MMMLQTKNRLINPQQPQRESVRKSSRLLAIKATFLITIATAQSGIAGVGVDASALIDAVTAEGVMVHLDALQEIANDNGGTREASSEGNLRSMIYVANSLTQAGYRVDLQVFPFTYFENSTPPQLQQISPVETTFEFGEEQGFNTLTYSGSGDVAAIAQAVDVILPAAPEANTSNSGCEPEDFAEFQVGNIALVQRGNCSFFQKASNAEAAGAVGVIIFNEGQEGRTSSINATLGGPGVTIPVVATSFAIGNSLASTESVVSLMVDTLTEIRISANVIADSPVGNEDHTVVVGAHLDSVDEGPGIQDNGSGSAAILETALQISNLGYLDGENPVVRNRLRFAFWGSEELGLVGSSYYVNTLSERDLGQIMANLNFDMIASPNYVRFVYDGDGSETTDFEGSGPEGSAFIEWLFRDYFEERGLANAPTAFNGRSDYGPFIQDGVDIPAGGLFTGAEGIKTEEEAGIYGGTAGEAYDACYHLACDTIDNINILALDEMSDAIAYAVNVLAVNRLPAPEAISSGRSLKTSRTLSINRADATINGITMDYDGPYLKR